MSMEIGMTDFWRKNRVTLLTIIFLFTILICVGYHLNCIYDSIIIRHLKLQEDQLSKWEFIKSLAYLSGLIALVVQITISNRRATAAEETAKAQLQTAEAQLQSNRETRYNNAMTNLLQDKPLACIGAIYNLYHISQDSDEYDSTIFDIFIEKLKTLCSLKAEGAVNWKRTKQLIVDKLFRGKDDSRVYEKNNLKIDLAELDLSGIDFTEAKLIDADLGGANCDYTIFEKVDLTRAKIPLNLEVCKSMNNAILNEVEASSGTNFKGLRLEEASLKDIKFSFVNLENAILKKANLERAVLKGCNLKGVNLTEADLTEADLTNADLTGAKGLTFEQLIMVKCLYQVVGLESNLYRRLNEKKPKLFVPNTG